MHQPQKAPRTPEQPRPRPVRSAKEAERIRVKNRRLEYLRRNPSYLESSDREFVDVKLYNTLIRSFQTPAERAAEARDKGFGQVLEASMLRNPEPLHRIDDEIVEEEEEEEEEEKDTREVRREDPPDDPDVEMSDDEGTPQEAGRRRWHAHVREWFVRGAAEVDGFDYAAVDEDSEYDTQARADEQDAWFDEEEPGWAKAEGDGETKGDGDGRQLTGQTGVQDY